jgi:hypothetical protein
LRAIIAAISLPVVPTNPQTLSATPTFDCTKAWITWARILCAYQDAANADWDITAAYWAKLYSLPEANREAFKTGHQYWLQSLNATCGLLPEQFVWWPQQGQCVLNAFHARAKTYRSLLRGDGLAESKLSPEEHAQLQIRLITLGLLVDDADGGFGPLTRDAIKRFQEQSGEPQNGFLTPAQRIRLLQAVALRDGGVVQPPSPGPVTPSGPSEACRMYPNLCY